jgi:hypothetical protein
MGFLFGAQGPRPGYYAPRPGYHHGPYYPGGQNPYQPQYSYQYQDYLTQYNHGQVNYPETYPYPYQYDHSNYGYQSPYWNYEQYNPYQQMPMPHHPFMRSDKESENM